MSGQWNPARAKVQLRLAVQRLRTLQEKQTALAKVYRRDIATLIERRKLETARIKTESLIHDDLYVELLELMELYCELLIARFGLLDINAREPDAGISEAVNSIIHAAPRTEVKELHVMREFLTHKYGREYSLGVMENRDGCVPARVISKLGKGMPPSDLVDAYLSEIARGYGIDDPIEKVKDDEEDDEDGNDGGGGGGLKENPEPELEPPLSSSLNSSILPSVPPPPSDTKPQVQFKPASPTKDADEGLDEYQALERRFAALKRK